MRRPRTKTLKTVFAWLHKQGLSVYGPGVIPGHMRYEFGFQDYNVDQALWLAKFKNKLGDPIYPGEGEDE